VHQLGGKKRSGGEITRTKHFLLFGGVKERGLAIKLVANWGKTGFGKQRKGNESKKGFIVLQKYPQPLHLGKGSGKGPNLEKRAGQK